MEPFRLPALIVATILASALAGRAYKRRSLTPSGSVAAFVVGFLLMACGWRGFNLFVFYFVAMRATKYKHDVKVTLDGALNNTSPMAPSSKTSTSTSSSTSTSAPPVRGIGQVLACSLIATVLSVIHAVYWGAERPIDYTRSGPASALTCGVIAHHATCLADTLASELGIVNTVPPVLITQPWRTVPSGTNGGVTMAGFGWSALGGTLIGVSTVLLDALSGIHNNNHPNDDGESPSAMSVTTQQQIPMILFATVCGLVGSILDSLLGATLQESYYDVDSRLSYQADDNHKPKSAKLVAGVNLLTNEQVNMISVALTTFLGGWVLGPLFFP